MLPQIGDTSSTSSFAPRHFVIHRLQVHVFSPGWMERTAVPALQLNILSSQAKVDNASGSAVCVQHMACVATMIIA